MKKGFTIIELIIVVGIIALISAIAIPNLLETRRQVNESSALNSLQNIQTAQKMYYLKHNIYAYDYGSLFLDDQLIKKNIYLANSTKKLSSQHYHGYYFASNTHYFIDNFMVMAIPKIYGTYGVHTFLANSSGTIYQIDLDEKPEIVIKKYQQPRAWNPEDPSWGIARQ